MAKRRRRGWALLPVLAALACAGSEAPGTGASPERDAGGGRLAVTRGDLVTHVLLTGELVAEDAEQLMVPNANIWPVQIRWLAEDGIEVREGERVVEFDNSQLTSNLEQLRTQAIEARNRLASLRAKAASEEATAVLELERQRAAVASARLEADVPDGVLAARTLEQRRLDLRRAELQMEEAEAKLAATRKAKKSEIEVQRIELQKAEVQVARQEARLEVLTLSAARDGILVLENHQRESRPLRVGDAVYPGWVVGRLPDLSTMIVEARLFDVDDGRVAPGMGVTATLDAFPEIAFSGRVRDINQIAERADGRSSRQVFRTRIDLDRVDTERMRPGMSVKVVIEQEHRDVLLVPRRCLDWQGTAAAESPRTAASGGGPRGGPRALLRDGARVPVSLGACDATLCVVEGGLEESVLLAPREDGAFGAALSARPGRARIPSEASDGPRAPVPGARG